jgi:hypothetical protein
MGRGDRDVFSECKCTRRQLARWGTGLAAGAAALWPPAFASAQSPAAAPADPTANGGTDPYPIPWLDKNGSHNQMPAASTEPSEIFHFNGFVARCADFTGTGTDNAGNRIRFGSPTTDFGVMQGQYWAARTTQTGTSAHL